MQAYNYEWCDFVNALIYVRNIEAVTIIFLADPQLFGRFYAGYMLGALCDNFQDSTVAAADLNYLLSGKGWQLQQ